MIQISPKEYITLPVYVEAWQLTLENLPQAAQWCRGRVKGESITFPKIRDRSKTLNSTDTNSYAVIGDYIVKVAQGYKVVKAEAFEKSHREARLRTSS